MELPSVCTSARRFVAIEPLSAEAFQPFGDVIEAVDTAAHYPINHGTAMRFDSSTTIDVDSEGGRAQVSIFRSDPVTLPMRVASMERHPLGSQTFFPLEQRPYLVLVSLGAERPSLEDLRCFIAGPGMGVNYARGTWHHGLLALRERSDFLVIDRAVDGVHSNCDESSTSDWNLWIEPIDQLLNT